MMAPVNQTVMIWVLIATSIGLVAGITYVYTNRNFRMTGIFTVTAILCITLIELIDIVHHRLKNNFIGSYNQHNLPYVAQEPGWQQILFAWHIWILPVVFSVILILAIFYILIRHRHVSVQHIMPRPLVTLSHDPETSSAKLSHFMAFEAIKNELHQAKEKLSEVLLANTNYEIKINELYSRTQDLDQMLAEQKKASQEEIELLQLELASKVREHEYLTEQLTKRNQELLHLQEMFEKLIALQRTLTETSSKHKEKP